MPKQEQSISLGHIDKETALALCYQALWQLNWNILFAGDNALVGSTPKNWKTKGQQIICTVEGEQLTITSEMVNGEMADITGKNKNNTTEFITALNVANACTLKPRLIFNLNFAKKATAAKTTTDTIQITILAFESFLTIEGCNILILFM